MIVITIIIILYHFRQIKVVFDGAKYVVFAPGTSEKVLDAVHHLKSGDNLHLSCLTKL